MRRRKQRGRKNWSYDGLKKNIVFVVRLVRERGSELPEHMTRLASWILDRARGTLHQCCGSGSGLWDPVSFWLLDPDPGSGIGFFPEHMTRLASWILDRARGTLHQCCGSGSGAFLTLDPDPGSGIGFFPDPGTLRCTILFLRPVNNSVADPGSEIRCLFDPWIRDGEKIKTRIRDEHSGSYFRELRNNFLG